MRAYYRKEGGLLEIVAIAEVDGQYFTPSGVPLAATGREEKLWGWPDSQVEAFVTHLGDEFLVPSS